ncbi:tyrosine-type recombinase/integrase [Micromonospora sp. STR1s_5]|nr:tyrosine-type recombinase/integrase [Micromonospora sp. STR1s_5]
MVKAQYKVVARGSGFQATVTSQALPKGRERRSFKSHAEADSWGATSVAALKAGQPISTEGKVQRRSPDDRPYTLNELFEYTKRERWEKKATTSDTIIPQAKSLVDTIGPDTPITKVDYHTITVALQKLESGRGIPARVNSGSTCNRKWAYLRVMLGYAVKLDIIQKIPSVEKRAEGNPRDFRVTPELERLMLTWATQHGELEFRDFILHGIYIGARENELLKLTLSKKTPHAGFVEDRHIVMPHPNPLIRNKGLRRDILMAPWIRQIVDARREAGEERIFPTLTKDLITRKWEKMRRDPVIRREVQKQPIPKDFVPHILRHEFCSRLGELGTSAFELMRLSGHKTLIAVQRYVKIDRTRSDTIMEQLFASTPHAKPRLVA